MVQASVGVGKRDAKLINYCDQLIRYLTFTSEEHATVFATK